MFDQPRPFFCTVIIVMVFPRISERIIVNVYGIAKLMLGTARNPAGTIDKRAGGIEIISVRSAEPPDIACKELILPLIGFGRRR